MLKLFEGVKQYVKPKTFEASTESFVVQLHRTTAILTLVLCVLVGGKQYLGEPINCIPGSGKKVPVPEKVLNNYCFIMTTYTVPEDYSKGCDAIRHAHPGVKSSRHDEPVVHHAYYQWVPIMLLIQTLSFAIPHVFWSHCEGGLIHRLLNGNTDIDVQKEAEKEAKVKKEEKEKPDKGKKTFRPRMELIAEYFIKTIRTHQLLAFGWFACDCLALIIVVVNFYVTDEFLGGNFSNYGLEVHNYFSSSPSQREGCFSPADRVFPKVTKCKFHKYGATGTIETIDTMCVMALNILNEKIYSVLWFWFILLIVLSALGTVLKLIIWMAIAYSSKSQMRALPMMALKFSGTPSYAAPLDLRILTRNLGFSDWIFFALLTRNMTPYIYKRFAFHLSNEKIDGIEFYESRI